MGSRESGEQFAIFADHRAAPLLEGGAWCAACGVPLQGGWRRVGVVAGTGVVSLVGILTLSERPER
jgi:hypothetical protein